MVDRFFVGLFVYIITIVIGSFFLALGRYSYYLVRGKISAEALEKFVEEELHLPFNKRLIAEDYDAPSSYLASIILTMIGSLIALFGLHSMWYDILIERGEYLYIDLFWATLGTVTFIRAWFFGNKLRKYQNKGGTQFMKTESINSE